MPLVCSGSRAELSDRQIMDLFRASLRLPAVMRHFSRRDTLRHPDTLPRTLLLSCIIFTGLASCGDAGSGGTGGSTNGSGGRGGSASAGSSGPGSGGAGSTGGAGSSGGSAVGVGAGGAGDVGGGGAGGETGSGGSSTGGNSSGGHTTGTGGGAGTATGGRGGAMAGVGGVTGMGGRGGLGGAGGSTPNGGVTGTGGLAGTGGATSRGGSTGSNTATLVPDPSWTCSMPDGIPPPTGGTLVFSVALTVSATHEVGNTQFGHRRQLDVSGGAITGDKLKGTVVTGGLDYELTLSTGAMEVEEVLIWKTSDNVTIFTRICGVAAAGDSVVRIVPDIEAPTSGSYAWLNTTKLVGSRVVDAAGNKIALDVYDVSKVTVGDPKVQLKDPAGVPNVSWNCVTATGSNGATVFTENVTLGSTVAVSNAKRGSRNIIPITGGTTTGKVAGKILNGGADYQLAASSGTTLDARYTLAPSNGEFIIVRNCGPINGLTPVFEARTDGAFAFLTTGKFLSSAPGGGTGGVSITFYERN
jgi:hypothetical protein